jgi:hypothetical protein
LSFVFNRTGLNAHLVTPWATDVSADPSLLLILQHGEAWERIIFECLYNQPPSPPRDVPNARSEAACRHSMMRAPLFQCISAACLSHVNLLSSTYNSGQKTLTVRNRSRKLQSTSRMSSVVISSVRTAKPDYAKMSLCFTKHRTIKTWEWSHSSTHL